MTLHNIIAAVLTATAAGLFAWNMTSNREGLRKMLPAFGAFLLFLAAMAVYAKGEEAEGRKNAAIVANVRSEIMGLALDESTRNYYLKKLDPRPVGGVFGGETIPSPTEASGILAEAKQRVAK